MNSQLTGMIEGISRLLLWHCLCVACLTSTDGFSPVNLHSVETLILMPVLFHSFPFGCFFLCSFIYVILKRCQSLLISGLDFNLLRKMKGILYASFTSLHDIMEMVLIFISTTYVTLGEILFCFCLVEMDIS